MNQKRWMIWWFGYDHDYFVGWKLIFQVRYLLLTGLLLHRCEGHTFPCLCRSKNPNVQAIFRMSKTRRLPAVGLSPFGKWPAKSNLIFELLLGTSNFESSFLNKLVFLDLSTLRSAVASKNALALSDAMIYLPKRTLIQGAARFYEHYIGTAITKKYAVYEAIFEDEGWGWGVSLLQNCILKSWEMDSPDISVIWLFFFRT